MGSVTRNKWYKYVFLKRYGPLARYLPKTRMMSLHSFRALLGKYGHVIVKPVWGSRGRGVIQVSKLGHHKYGIHYENRQKVKRGKKNTYRYLRKKIGSTPYMVQKRITRPTIDNRPFDMRVIVQRKRHSSHWVVTGKVIKVAGKGYIVSNNTRSKGQLHKFKSGIRKSSIRHLSVSDLESKIDKVSIRSAKRLGALFPHHRIYGMDIATNQKGRVAIIETNLYPAMSHFRKLNDRELYNRIMSYKRG
ncbi:YheC/YheD family protein [Paenibacillus sp. KQZ6P-2]|uniref:YheC/YheD family protein n=1 Tax=Paenibacillus mangrovi TaxID=2931978 RepID=A0A9X1WQP1_9BACL|nr:YheC/YheD family protein [Paenibacillus mangrovi]MCJ8012921.1 YheC/YheD family protein [Paenibacillus mangrovi]